MYGKLIWWSRTQQHGIISSNTNGQNQRFFVHISKITSGPDELKAGYYIRFEPGVIPKPGLLCVLYAEVSIEPFPEANEDGASPKLEVGRE